MKRHFILCSLLAAAFTNSTRTEAQALVALTTNNELVKIANASMPGMASAPMSITGIAMGQAVVGIDYRPNTGELYALGYNAMLSVGNAQLYVINSSTGVATAVGTPISLSLGSGGIGFDFNPTVDRIRVVAENGSNYRLHPITGAVAATDGNLAFAATDPNASVMPKITACAYTNSYIGSEATTLYDYDHLLNVLATQVPPNNGTLNTVGSSGIIVGTTALTTGMDIYFDPTTKRNRAYLSSMVSGSNNLYTIDLSSGMTTLVGSIGTGVVGIREIAAEIDRTVPATYTGQLIYGLTKVNRNLVKFSSGNPELIRELLPITGVTPGQTIVGMDIRPMDLALYALGYNDTTRAYQLYTINTATGAATAIGSQGTINLGMGQKIGFDFNPTVDRIRVISTNDSNYRLNPITGAIAATDTSLSYSAADANVGENPYVSSVAYTNSFKGTTSTMLFGVDDSLGVFLSIAPPNQGFLNTLATNLVLFNLADLTNDIDFYYDSVTSQNIGYMAANTGTAVNDVLYRISGAGMASLVDSIGMGVQLSDIAVQLSFTNSPTNVREMDKKEIFTISPNPCTDMITISFATGLSNNSSLILTDLSGRVVKTVTVSKTAGSIPVDISGLVKGMYFIHLSDKSATAVKFLKQ
jgi:hypothetical protein